MKLHEGYEQEINRHIKNGARIDNDNGSIIRTSKRIGKVKAESRNGQVALLAERPVLPTTTFEAVKGSLLEEHKGEQVDMPQLKFLDNNQKAGSN